MMSTSNGRGEQVSVSVAGPERSGGPSTDTSRPDPEVPEKAKRDSSVPSTSSAFLRRPARARNRDRSRRCCAAKGCILRTCRNGGALGEKGR